MQDNGVPEARRKILHRLFLAGIWLKGLDGILELGCGLLLLVASPEALDRHIVVIIHHEMQHDSGHLFVAALRHIANHLTIDSKLAAGAYLTGNGMVKVLLAFGILRGKLWYYPAGLTIIGLFVLLQCGRLAFHFSFLMLAANFVDLAILLLIWREYRHIKRSYHGS